MIILLRHGRVLDGKGLCLGRTDAPLSPDGKDQARKVADELEGIPFARLCSSPAARTRATLHPLAERLGLEVETLPALAEIDMGKWDGLDFETIRQRYPAEYAERGKCLGRYRVPGGESFEDVADRAMETLTELARGPMPVLAATHAGVIRTVLCRVTGHPLDDLFHFTPGYARCTLLRADGTFELVGEDVFARTVRELL
ncbi:histidine phosphatase family protein [uncultured Pseudodesulfovibrio sp.]|uniref:histidine phosphatase family protein n=1 Tax=uncultured Pseudodesulfovibrio sp. TaxID=2035858 RepID=UPI0029C8B763|nr:histidine phosphatase family protein [uncultured Pseudodesulfovibrio sp.]